VAWQTVSNRPRKRRTKESRADQSESNGELAFVRLPLERCFVNRVPSFHIVPMQANVEVTRANEGVAPAPQEA